MTEPVHFAIDEARRELWLGGRHIELEPRVFDVVAYLAAHSDRVVAKDELLDAVWPDLDVGDGSLQRAVSVARAALRDGGLGDPIRTYARRGYRFCLDLSDVPAGSTAATPGGAAAHDAYRARDWLRAVNEFACSDRDGQLEAEDLEAYGHAMLRAGHLRQAPAILERAVEGYVARGERRAAARAAVVLGMAHWQCEDLALAGGWQRRAAALIDGEQECRETGLVAWLDAFVKILGSDFAGGTQRAQEVYELGVRLRDVELQALGRAFSATGALAMGRPDAAALLDEAAATAISVEVSEWAGAHILCGVLWGYRNVGAWDRASQWSDQYERWCERTGMWRSPGTWRLHRAEVLANCVDLDAAIEEATAVAGTLGELAPWALGDAWRLIGEIRVEQHDFAGAQAAFEEAANYGWDPQPGLALLYLARARPSAAVRSLERSLESTGFLDSQRKAVLTGYLILALVASGDIERAGALADELEGHSRDVATPALQALVARGRAEVAALAGDLPQASHYATTAVQRWSEAGSLLNEARARLRLAQLLLANGEVDGADIEAGIACRLASRLHARSVASQCDDLRGAIARGEDGLFRMPELGPWEGTVSRVSPGALGQLLLLEWLGADAPVVARTWLSTLAR